MLFAINKSKLLASTAVFLNHVGLEELL